MKKACLIILVLAFAVVANAETIVFQDGLPNAFYPGQDTNTTAWDEYAYQGTNDTLVAAGGSYVNLNYGGRDAIAVGNPFYHGSIQTGLLKFDLSALAGVTVTGATLELWSRGFQYPLYVDQQFSIHEMQAANGGWLQGDKTGAQAVGDEVTFGAKSFSLGGAWAGGYGPLNWANPAFSGGEPDYVQTPIATHITTGNPINTNYQQYLNDVPASIIQSWVGQDVRDVAGLLIRADFMREFDPEVDPWHYPYTSPSYVNLIASEYATGQFTYPFRPKLTVEYVPEPMTMVLLGLGGLFIRRKK